MKDSQQDFVPAAKVSLLWLALVVGMTLHFTYGVSGLRFGIAMEAEGADGTVPWSNFGVKTIFYVIPFLMAVIATSVRARSFRLFNLVSTGLFALANTSHVVGTAMRADDPLDYAQVVLLSALLLANLQLIRVSLAWYRSDAAVPSTT